MHFWFSNYWNCIYELYQVSHFKVFKLIRVVILEIFIKNIYPCISYVYRTFILTKRFKHLSYLIIVVKSQLARRSSQEKIILAFNLQIIHSKGKIYSVLLITFISEILLSKPLLLMKYNQRRLVEKKSDLNTRTSLTF